MRAFALSTGPVLSARPPRATRTCAVRDGAADIDESLVARVAGGDRAAFAALFDRYAARVKAYLIRLGARGALAEDLAQDAMVAVWRRAASFDPTKAKVSTWMFVIARNAWIDRLRREKVELAYRGALDLSEESDDERPDAAVARIETEEQMQAALMLLSPEQRQVVQLSFFEDRPHSEIAQRLSLPLGTVKSRLRLALAKLRTHWEQHQ
ncbi:MAG: sigma-70 family RNA polymerase sigma factor [Phycisphaerales bacterium]|nr:sigma-70 family RNA polymerase sigma factor [Hyphomonadaceae bacterium]